jgi:hypothetical protein
MNPTPPTLEQCKALGGELCSLRSALLQLRAGRHKGAGLSGALRALFDLQCDLEDAMFRLKVPGADTNIFRRDYEHNNKTVAQALAHLDAAQALCWHGGAQNRLEKVRSKILVAARKVAERDVQRLIKAEAKLRVARSLWQESGVQ